MMDRITKGIRRIVFFVLLVWISWFATLWESKFHWPVLIALVVLLAWDIRRTRAVLTDKPALFLLLFVWAAAFSCVGVINPPVAFEHFEFYIAPAVALFAFARLTVSARFFLSPVRLAVLLAAGVSVFGIKEMALKTNFLYPDFIANPYYPVSIGRRMMSVHMHPVVLGTYFAAVLPLAIGLYFSERAKALRIAALFCAAFIALGLILTFSRGALAGGVIGTAVLIALCGRTKKKILFAGLAACVFLLVAFFSLINFSSPKGDGQGSFGRLSISGLSAPIAHERKIARLKSIVPIIRDHPVKGLGPGHYRVLFHAYVPQRSPYANYDGQVADLAYLTLLAETGLLGFSFFLVFIILLVRKALRRIKPLTGFDRWRAACFLAGFAGMLVCFLTFDGLYWTMPAYLFWMYAGIIDSA